MPLIGRSVKKRQENREKKSRGRNVAKGLELESNAGCCI